MTKAQDLFLVGRRGMDPGLDSMRVGRGSMGITVVPGMAVLVEHPGLLISVLFAAEINSKGDRKSGECEGFFHNGWLFGWSGAPGQRPCNREWMHPLEHARVEAIMRILNVCGEGLNETAE
jgi:hypothetical protein